MNTPAHRHTAPLPQRVVRHHSTNVIRWILITVLMQITVAHGQNLYFPPLQGGVWETVTPAALGWESAALDTLIDYLENEDTKALIILKGGRLVVEHYYDNFTADSLWYWASAGKSLTAFLVGLAQQDGLLNETDTVSTHLGMGWTSLTPAQEAKITIQHQLSMSTGLDDGVADVDCTLPACLLFADDAGTRWAYHNAPYTLLWDVLQSTSGVTLNNLINQQLLPKTGIQGFYLPLGYNRIFFSTPRSMARFGLLMLGRGTWDNTPVLFDTAYFNRMTSPSQPLNESYGYLWWLNGQQSYMLPGLQHTFQGMYCPNAPSDMIMAWGLNGQIINVVPSEQLVVVRMGNSSANNPITPLLNDTIWSLLNRVTSTNIANPTTKVDKPLFRLYPNPASSDRIMIEPTVNLQDENFLLLVHDNTGRIIQHHRGKGSQPLSLSIPNAASGIYHVRLMTDSGLNHQARWVRQ